MLTQLVPAFSRPTLYPGFYFKVSIVNEKGGMIGKGMAAMEESFEEVTGLSFTIESEKRFVNNAYCQVPTSVTYNNITLKRAFMSPDSELVKWCTEPMKNNFTEITLKTIIITLMNISTGLAVSEWKVFNAYPKRYQIDGFNSNQNQLLMESVEIMYEKFEVLPVKASNLLGKAVSALNKTKAGQQLIDNMRNRRDNAIGNAKNIVTEKTNSIINSTTKGIDSLLDKITPDALKGKPKTSEKSLLEKAVDTANKNKDKVQPQPTKEEEKKPEPQPKKEEEKKPEPQPKKEEPKPQPKKEEEKKPEPQPKKEDEKKPEPKKEDKKPEPKKEEKKPEPQPKKEEEKKPEPKKEEKAKPKTASERVAERQKAAEKKHVDNQQKGRDNKNNKGGKK